jgi:hypothetical protein
MDIGYLTSDAAKYPLNNWKKVIVLGILFLISFLIVPVFLTLGYLFRVIKWTIAEVDELPNYDNWGSMFLDGLKVFLVQLAYFIIPFIIIFIGLWASLDLINYQINTNTLAPTAVFSLMSGLLILGMFLAVIFGAFFTIALANMAYYDGELSAAFRFKELLKMIQAIGWVDFIIWYIMMILVGCGIGFLAFMLLLIPILGWALSIIVLNPYIYLLYARALGLLFVSGFENHQRLNNEFY